jgi:hypothetical protein
MAAADAVTLLDVAEVIGNGIVSDVSVPSPNVNAPQVGFPPACRVATSEPTAFAVSSVTP